MATKKAAPKKVVKVVKPASPVGRPTKYKPEYVDLAYKFCLMGATDAKLADFFEVDETTINEWKLVYPEFSQSIWNGREKADADIAESLYHRAKGYSHVEDDIRTLSIGGGMSEIVVTPTRKHYPPDTAAASLWLRNRAPKLWRDKVDVEHTGSVGLDSAPIEELQTALNNILAKLK